MKKEWVQVTSDGIKENLLPKTTADMVYIDDSLTATARQALMANTGVDAYTHTYNPDTRVHHFVGMGRVGWVRVTAPYTPGDTFLVNGAVLKVYVPQHDPLLTCFVTGQTVAFTRSYDAIVFQTCGARTKTRDVELYGVRINKADPNPDTRCAYLFDAEGKRPAKIIYHSSGYHFDYGDWADVGFVRDNRPVMLRSDGKVAYALDPNDLALRAGGGASDIANTAFDGNAMSEMPRWWLKQYEDEKYQYILVSPVQYDEDFHAYAFTREDGSPADNLYMPMYRGSYSNGKLRSLSGQPLMTSTYIDEEIARATANGACWGTRSWAQVDYVNALLTLISCSTDHQRAFGRGKCASDVGGTGGALNTGTLNTQGQFFGYKDNDTARVKVFWCEDWWGNTPDRIAGMVMVGGRILVKMIPPYNVSGTDYIDTGIVHTIPNGYGTKYGYIKNMHVSQYGKIPKDIESGEFAYQSSDGISYWCDYFESGTDAYAMVGGDAFYSKENKTGSFALALTTPANYRNSYNASLSALP